MVIGGLFLWFLFIYHGARLSRRRGLHHRVATFLGARAPPSPVLVGATYSLMTRGRKHALICAEEGTSLCHEARVDSRTIQNSCFAAQEIHDDMDDRGRRSHSHIVFLQYTCPGDRFGYYLSYVMANEPFPKALRVSLVREKREASPWRLYKDAEGVKLQCFGSGPGKDHWVGYDLRTSASVLVEHPDSSGQQRHSAFSLALVADERPSPHYDYALFQSSTKGFLSCNESRVCSVFKRQSALSRSCWRLHPKDDGYVIKSTCRGSPLAGLSLGTVSLGSHVHVGLTEQPSVWSLGSSNASSGHVITLTTGDYAGYKLGASSKAGFFFIRRAEEPGDAKSDYSGGSGRAAAARRKSGGAASGGSGGGAGAGGGGAASSGSVAAQDDDAPPAAELAKYSTKKVKFLGCFQDKWDRDLKVGPRRWGFTPEKCAEACPSFLYVGVQGGSWCSCGNMYGKHGRIDLELCEKEGKMVGGQFANAIYQRL